MKKNNLSPPYKLRLRLIAVYNDTDNLSPADKSLISALLRHIADGKPADDFFGVKKAAHRPRTGNIEQRIWDVCLSMAPKNMGGDGLNRASAIQCVAQEHKIADSTLIESLKTKTGRALYREFRAVLKPVI